MVETIDGNGSHFRNLMESLELTKQFQMIRFREDHDLQREAKILNGLSGKLDAESILLTNVVDASNNPLHVLLVPLGSRDRLIGRSGEGSMPPAGETYLAEVRNIKLKTKIEVLVMSDSSEDVESIAKSKTNVMFRGRNAWRTKDLIVNYRPISPEEFIEIAKRTIDRGIRLRGSILRFGDLAEYQRQHSLRVKPSKSK